MMLVDGMFQLSFPWRGSVRLVDLRQRCEKPRLPLLCDRDDDFVYALVLPVLLLIPKALIATADAEPNPELDAQVLAEISTSTPASR